MRLDPITIVPYDPAWPTSFEAQRVRIEAALAGVLVGPVEHIGSTSVPGLAAKSIIDMLARVDGYDHAARIAAAMAGIGWFHAPEPGDETDRKMSFCFPDIAHRSHHLHVVQADSAGWSSWLAFRDHLRTHPADAAAYGELKAQLAAEDARDRPRYRAAKAPFIADVLRRSAAEGGHREVDRP
ncbi:GrpB family protein [Catellatospora sp. NEAU-YM18]|nr:GrpB family protein [Catellatospora tritici]